jgi:hypothetical protein
MSFSCNWGLQALFAFDPDAGDLSPPPAVAFDDIMPEHMRLGNDTPNDPADPVARTALTRQPLPDRAALASDPSIHNHAGVPGCIAPIDSQVPC